MKIVFLPLLCHTSKAPIPSVLTKTDSPQSPPNSNHRERPLQPRKYGNIGDGHHRANRAGRAGKKGHNTKNHIHAYPSHSHTSKPSCPCTYQRDEGGRGIADLIIPGELERAARELATARSVRPPVTFACWHLLSVDPLLFFFPLFIVPFHCTPSITSGGHPHGLPLHGRAHPADGDGRALGGTGHRAGLLGLGQGCAPAHRRGQFLFTQVAVLLFVCIKMERQRCSLTHVPASNHTHIHIVRPTPPSWRPPWPPRTSEPRTTRPASTCTFSLA